MRREHWDRVFEPLVNAARKAGDDMAWFSQKQKDHLDRFVNAVRDTDSHAMKDWEFHPHNKGPLSDDVASTFSGSNYDVHVLDEDMVLFRAGDKKYALGSFWSENPPFGEMQTRMDYAVERWWRDKDGNVTGESILERGYAVNIPKGTTIYMGPTAGRGDFMLGGATQIYIPWNTPGLEPLAQWDLGW